MKVRDLIENLQRFEPTSEVAIEASGEVFHPSGVLHGSFQETLKINEVVTAEGQPLIIAIK